MQDIQQETLNECTKTEQSALVVLWEIDLTEVGGDRYFFCNEQNEKGEPVTWQGRQYQAYPIQGSGFEMNGKGASARPTLKVSNLYGMVTGMAEDLQSLVGGTVVRRKVYARFLDTVNFVNGNSDADAYHLAGIEMPDFHREDDWWRNCQNLYLDNLEATGLYQVPLSAAQPGDVLLCCFGSSVPNHAAIYCGDGELLHHIPEQLSKRERYTDKWQRRTHSLWRHRAWRASAFTGIYNDLVAASTFV